MLRYLTAGESHGKALSVIIEGVPAGLQLSVEDIQQQLIRRKQGYGRGPRQKIETDDIEILSGVRHGKTIASPISIVLKNKDASNWKGIMDVDGNPPEDYQPISIPRPGHADYAGMRKYEFDDIRNVLERSSARETAMRVVAGAIARNVCEAAGVQFASYVDSIGGVILTEYPEDVDTINRVVSRSKVRTTDPETEKNMIKTIDDAMKDGVSLGGTFVVVANGLPVGLGSYVQWDRKLDARLSRAVMSIQAIKGVEFGLGFKSAILPGDKVHDEFRMVDEIVERTTNHAGGIEGGMTNGQPLVLRAAMKPIPTMKSPLQSIDLVDSSEVTSFYERADVCAVPAAAVVAENVVAIEIANALIDRYGGDTISQLSKLQS